MDMVHDYVHFASRNQKNSLILLNNRGSPTPDPPKCERFDDKITRSLNGFGARSRDKRVVYPAKADSPFFECAPGSTGIWWPAFIDQRRN
jgi:hypothetical protein